MPFSRPLTDTGSIRGAFAHLLYNKRSQTGNSTGGFYMIDFTSSMVLISHGFIAVIPKTPGATTEFGVGGFAECFEIRLGGSFAQGYVCNQDFPGETVMAERGELFFIYVPQENRLKGIGSALAKDALRLMSGNGTRTINIASISTGGAWLVAAMVHKRWISFIRKAGNKSEYKINSRNLLA
jgi:GNAT superfamily N-acetyltransferase